MTNKHSVLVFQLQNCNGSTRSICPIYTCPPTPNLHDNPSSPPKHFNTHHPPGCVWLGAGTVWTAAFHQTSQTRAGGDTGTSRPHAGCRETTSHWVDIRESADSLCRDGADMPRPPYIRKACTRPNATLVSLFSRLTVVLKCFCT